MNIPVKIMIKIVLFLVVTSTVVQANEQCLERVKRYRLDLKTQGKLNSNISKSLDNIIATCNGDGFGKDLIPSMEKINRTIDRCSERFGMIENSKGWGDCIDTRFSLRGFRRLSLGKKPTEKEKKDLSQNEIRNLPKLPNVSSIGQDQLNAETYLKYQAQCENHKEKIRTAEAKVEHENRCKKFLDKLNSTIERAVNQTDEKKAEPESLNRRERAQITRRQRQQSREDQAKLKALEESLLIKNEALVNNQFLEAKRKECDKAYGDVETNFVKEKVEKACASFLGRVSDIISEKKARSEQKIVCAQSGNIKVDKLTCHEIEDSIVLSREQDDNADLFKVMEKITLGSSEGKKVYSESALCRECFQKAYEMNVQGLSGDQNEKPFSQLRDELKEKASEEAAKRKFAAIKHKARLLNSFFAQNSDEFRAAIAKDEERLDSAQIAYMFEGQEPEGENQYIIREEMKKSFLEKKLLCQPEVGSLKRHSRLHGMFSFEEEEKGEFYSEVSCRKKMADIISDVYAQGERPSILDIPTTDLMKKKGDYDLGLKDLLDDARKKDELRSKNARMDFNDLDHNQVTDYLSSLDFLTMNLKSAIESDKKHNQLKKICDNKDIKDPSIKNSLLFGTIDDSPAFSATMSSLTTLAESDYHLVPLLNPDIFCRNFVNDEVKQAVSNNLSDKFLLRHILETMDHPLKNSISEDENFSAWFADNGKNEFKDKYGLLKELSEDLCTLDLEELVYNEVCNPEQSDNYIETLEELLAKNDGDALIYNSLLCEAKSLNRDFEINPLESGEFEVNSVAERASLKEADKSTKGKTSSEITQKVASDVRNPDSALRRSVNNVKSRRGERRITDETVSQFRNEIEQVVKKDKDERRQQKGLLEDNIYGNNQSSQTDLAQSSNTSDSFNSEAFAEQLIGKPLDELKNPQFVSQSIQTNPVRRPEIKESLQRLESRSDFSKKLDDVAKEAGKTPKELEEELIESLESGEPIEEESKMDDETKKELAKLRQQIEDQVKKNRSEEVDKAADERIAKLEKENKLLKSLLGASPARVEAGRSQARIEQRDPVSGVMNNGVAIPTPSLSFPDKSYENGPILLDGVANIPAKLKQDFNSEIANYKGSNNEASAKLEVQGGISENAPQRLKLVISSLDTSYDVDLEKVIVDEKGVIRQIKLQGIEKPVDLSHFSPDSLEALQGYLDKNKKILVDKAIEENENRSQALSSIKRTASYKDLILK